jgi:uncharacterized membrane protein
MTSQDDLRIGDWERDKAMAALREHFAQGRLTAEELDERLGDALTARTGGDLRRLTADLPEPHGTSDRAEWLREPRHPEPYEPHADAGPATSGPRPGPHPGFRGPGRRRGGLPIGPIVAAVVVLAMVAGVGPVFGLVKVVFIAWLLFAVVGLIRHGNRRHHRHHR